MRTLDFIVHKLEDDKVKGLVTSVMVSTISGIEFTTASASAISVSSDSSSRSCHELSIMQIKSPLLI